MGTPISCNTEIVNKNPFFSGNARERIFLFSKKTQYMLFIINLNTIYSVFRVDFSFLSDTIDTRF